MREFPHQHGNDLILLARPSEAQVIYHDDDRPGFQSALTIQLE
jgi:hypothetical protein